MCSAIVPEYNHQDLSYDSRPSRTCQAHTNPSRGELGGDGRVKTNFIRNTLVPVLTEGFSMTPNTVRGNGFCIVEVVYALMRAQPLPKNRKFRAQHKEYNLPANLSTIPEQHTQCTSTIIDIRPQHPANDSLAKPHIDTNFHSSTSRPTDHDTKCVHQS